MTRWPLKSASDTGVPSWSGRVNSGAVVPASSWGMVFLTTMGEWGHNSAFAHTVSSSPLTIRPPVVLSSSSEEVAGDLAGDLLGVVTQLGGQVVVEPEGGQPMDQGPGGHGGTHVVAAVGAVGGLGGRWVQQCPGLVRGQVVVVARTSARSKLTVS